MHFCTSFIHKYVSPVFQGTHQVSENTTLSIFLHTQISKNGAATDLIKTDLNTVLTSGQWRYGYWANSTNQEETATAIAVRKHWRRCSTYARPVSGAVVCHKSSEEDLVTMVTLLFILRCGFFSPSPRQAFAPAALIQCNPSPSRQAL